MNSKKPGKLRCELQSHPQSLLCQEKEPPPPISFSFYFPLGRSAKKKKQDRRLIKNRREKGKPTYHLGRSNLTTQKPLVPMETTSNEEVAKVSISTKTSQCRKNKEQCFLYRANLFRLWSLGGPRALFAGKYCRSQCRYRHLRFRCIRILRFWNAGDLI